MPVRYRPVHLVQLGPRRVLVGVRGELIGDAVDRVFIIRLSVFLVCHISLSSGSLLFLLLLLLLLFLFATLLIEPFLDHVRGFTCTRIAPGFWRQNLLERHRVNVRGGIDCEIIRPVLTRVHPVSRSQHRARRRHERGRVHRLGHRPPRRRLRLFPSQYVLRGDGSFRRPRPLGCFQFVQPSSFQPLSFHPLHLPALDGRDGCRGGRGGWRCAHRRAHVGLLHLLRQRLEPEVFGYSSPLGVHLRE